MPSKRKNTSVTSKLEQEMDEDEYSGITQQYIPESHCPKFCPKFACIINEKDCHNECDNIESAGALICDLCKDETICGEKRRAIILNPEYVRKTKEKNTEAVKISNSFDNIILQHKHIELSYREKKDQLLTLQWYNIGRYMVLNNEIQELEMKLKYYREVMDIMKIDHDKEINIDQANVKKKGIISPGNLIMIGLILLVLIVYLFAK